MDTSKEYILMASKAEEIQKKWKPQEGDYCIGKKSKGYIQFGVRPIGLAKESVCFDNESDYYEERDDIIFLPRQDQLQEMWTKGINCLPYAFQNTFNNWCKKNYPYADKPNSMEQLWLAFCMHELYQKRWDGNEWVKS